jgi:hypothetical protein
MDVSGQLHVPTVLPPGKEPLVPTGYEAGWVPEPFWTCWWSEKFPAPTGNRTLQPRSSGSYLVAIPTELSRLVYCKYKSISVTYITLQRFSNCFSLSLFKYLFYWKRSKYMRFIFCIIYRFDMMSCLWESWEIWKSWSSGLWLLVAMW